MNKGNKKTNIYRRQIKRILNAAKIVDDASYEINGHRKFVTKSHPYYSWNKPFRSFGENLGKMDQNQKQLTEHLAASIYDIFYSSVDEGKSIKSNRYDFPPKEERKAFMDVLSRENNTKNDLDKMWVVESILDQGIRIRKNENSLLVNPNQIVSVNGDLGFSTNSLVHLIVNKESREAQPTFYHVFSQNLMSPEAELIRFYFHLDGDLAPVLLNRITHFFNKYRLPFYFKCLNHKDLFNRTDSAVLYLNRMDWHLGFVLLNKAMVGIKESLKDKVPLFTKKIGKGMSFAEDPGQGRSFGLTRCQMISESIVSQFYEDLKLNRKSMKWIEAKSKESGMDLDNLFLKANSHIDYNFDLFSS